MKRIFLTLLSTALIALLGLPAAAGFARETNDAPALSRLSQEDLQTVTAGRCSRCDDEEEDEEEEPDRHPLAYAWYQSRQVDGPSEQLGYSILTERSNVYGMDTIPYDFTFSDNCRYRWTSGGVGITTGFNIALGRTYHCAQEVKVAGTVRPGYRVKIYKGDMRQIHTVTMKEYLVFSDGSREATGRSDTGRKANYWSRYTDVIAR